MLDEYGVGRASLREALRLLEVNDLIYIKPGSGGGPVVGSVEASALGRTLTLFLQMSGATLGELLQARVELEVALVPLAMQRTDSDLDQLRQVVEAARTTELADDDQFKSVTYDFHVAIANLSGNPVLDLMCRALMEIFHSRVDQEIYPMDRRANVHKEHEALAAAILQRQQKKAVTLARSHLEGYLSSIKQRHPSLVDRVIDWH